MVTPRKARMVLAILSLAAFMAGLDLFIVNVAFADIGKEFKQSSLADLSWVLNAYAIVFAALLVPLGRLADRFGRKNGFLYGVALFTLASGACAVATSLWQLVLFRVLQALGAAALTPASLGLLLHVFPPEKRAAAVRVWSASAALAAAAGPVFGGLLVSASWRWVFLVNLPIGVLALAAAAKLVPDSRDERVGKAPDLVGAGLLTAAIGLLALGLVKVNDWPGVRTTLVLAAAALGVAAFWLRSRRHEAPVVEPALLRLREFSWANVAVLAFSAGFAANLLSAILWMQNVWHWSALRTGLAVAPGPLLVPVAALLAGRFAGRVPVGRIAAAGCLLCGAGALAMALMVGREPHYATELLPGWLVGGVGVGLALPTILSTAAAGLPAERFSTGSAVVNMSRQIGSVLGISLLVAVMGTPRTYDDAHHAYLDTCITVGLFMLLGAAPALGMSPRPALDSPASVASDTELPVR
ncbi:MFS transporter [Kitasatospora sp. NPDC002227]|uniref:MFS transporter n=1 Tax=Kitasatospora sp. NPDC002227 TaxID=3154773 RepID=UPI003333C380